MKKNKNNKKKIKIAARIVSILGLVEIGTALVVSLPSTYAFFFNALPGEKKIFLWAFIVILPVISLIYAFQRFRWAKTIDHFVAQITKGKVQPAEVAKMNQAVLNLPWKTSLQYLLFYPIFIHGGQFLALLTLAQLNTRTIVAWITWMLIPTCFTPLMFHLTSKLAAPAAAIITEKAEQLHIKAKIKRANLRLKIMIPTIWITLGVGLYIGLFGYLHMIGATVDGLKAHSQFLSRSFSQKLADNLFQEKVSPKNLNLAIEKTKRDLVEFQKSGFVVDRQGQIYLQPEDRIVFHPRLSEFNQILLQKIKEGESLVLYDNFVEKIVVAQAVPGTLYLAGTILPLADYLGDLNKKTFWLIGFIIWITCCALLLGYFPAISISGAVKHLVEATKRIASGDLKARAKKVSEDELGDLAVSFNQMTEDLRKSRSELESSKIFVENISNANPDAVMLASPEGKFVSINQGAEKMTGYKAEELIGQPVTKIVAKQDWQTAFERVRETFEKGAINFNLIFQHKTGEQFPVNFNAVIVKDASGKVIGALGVARDMREIQKLIKELEEAKTSLEQKVRERTAELEEAKTGLEIKVRARTKELEELTQNLEKQVQARTQEIAGKVKELEKFNKLAVGRELKMIELKEEIERLKKK